MKMRFFSGEGPIALPDPSPVDLLAPRPQSSLLGPPLRPKNSSHRPIYACDNTRQNSRRFRTQNVVGICKFAFCNFIKLTAIAQWDFCTEHLLKLTGEFRFRKKNLTSAAVITFQIALHGFLLLTSIRKCAVFILTSVH